MKKTYDTTVTFDPNANELITVLRSILEQTAKAREAVWKSR